MWPGDITSAWGPRKEPVVKMTIPANRAHPVGTAEQAEPASDARRGEEEERSDEAFEATILRLDSLTLELLFRKAGE